MPDPQSLPPTPLSLAQQLVRLGLQAVPAPAVHPAGPVSLPTPYDVPPLATPLRGMAARIVESYRAAGGLQTLVTNEPIERIPPVFGWQFPIRTRLSEMTSSRASRYVLGVLEGIRLGAQLRREIRKSPLALLDIETVGERRAIVTELAISLYGPYGRREGAQGRLPGSQVIRTLRERLSRPKPPPEAYAWLIAPTAAQQRYIEGVLAKAAAGQGLTSEERAVLARLARYAGATLEAQAPSLAQVRLQQEAVERSQALLRSGVRLSASDIALAQAGLQFLREKGVPLEQVAASLQEILARRPILAGLNIRLFDIPVLRRFFAGGPYKQLRELLAQARVLDILELADLLGPEEVHRQLLRAAGRKDVSDLRFLRHLARLPSTPLAQESLLYSLLGPGARVAHTAAADVLTTAQILGALVPALERGAKEAARLQGRPFDALEGLRADALGRIFAGKRPVRLGAPVIYAPQEGGWGIEVFVPRAVIARPPSFVLEESTGEAMYHPPKEPVTLLSREYLYQMGTPSVVRSPQGRPLAVTLAFRSPELRRTAFMVELIDPALRAQGEPAAIEEATRRIQARVLAAGVVPVRPDLPRDLWGGLLQESLADRARRTYQRLFEIDRSRTSGILLLRQLQLAQDLMRQAGNDVRQAWARLQEAVQSRQITHAVAIDALTLFRPGPSGVPVTRLAAELPYLSAFVERMQGRFTSEAQLVLAMRRFHRLLSQSLFQEPEQTFRALRPGERQVLLYFGERPHWIPVQSPSQFVERLSRAMESQIAPGVTAAERAATQLFLLQQAIDALGAQAPIRVPGTGRVYQALSRAERALLRRAAASAGADLEVAFRNQATMLYRILSRRLDRPGPEVTVGGVRAPVYHHFLTQGQRIPTLNLYAGVTRMLTEERAQQLMEEAAAFAARLTELPEDPLLRYAVRAAERAQQGRFSQRLSRLYPGGGVGQAPPIGILPWWVESPAGRRHFLTLYAPSEAGTVLAAIEQGLMPAPSALSATIEIPTIEEIARVPVGGGETLPVRAIRYGGQERVVPLAFVGPRGVRSAEEILQTELERHIPPLVRQLSAAMSRKRAVDPNRMAARIRRAFRDVVERLAGMDTELLSPEERAKVRVTAGTYAAARRGLMVDFRELLEEQARTSPGGPLMARIEAAREAVERIPYLLRQTQHPQWVRLADLVQRYGIFGLKDDELVEGKLAAIDPRILVPFGAHYSPTHPNVMQFLAHYRFAPEQLRQGLPEGVLPYAVLATQEYRAWEQALGRGRIGTVSVVTAVMSAQDVMRRIEQLAKAKPRSIWADLVRQNLIPAPYESAVLLARELKGTLPGELLKQWRIPLHTPGVELHPEIQKWLEQALASSQPVERRFPRGTLPYIYRIGRREYGAVPDRTVILRQAFRDVEGRDLVISGVALHPIEPGAKVLLGTIKGAAFPFFTREHLEELTGLPGVTAVAVTKTRDIGNVAGMLASFFGEVAMPRLQAMGEDVAARQQFIQTLQDLFRRHFQMELQVVRLPAEGPGPPPYAFLMPGLRRGELPTLVQTAKEDPVAPVRRFLEEAAQQLGLQLPPGLLPTAGTPAEPVFAQRLLLPLVRAQVQEVLKFRSALGTGTGGWELHPQEVLSMANWSTFAGRPTPRLMDFLMGLVEQEGAVRPGKTYQAFRGVLEQLAALYPAEGVRAPGVVPPPERVVSVAELGPLPLARQRRGGLTAQVQETTIVGPRPGGRLRLRPGEVWYLQMPERLPERLAAEGGLALAPGRFVHPITQQPLDYLPVGYVPLGQARRAGTWDTEYHAALKRLQNALRNLERVQADREAMALETYERLAQRANQRVEAALEEYFRVLRSAVTVKPKAGGMVVGMLETFRAPASRYFITAPYLPPLSAIQRALEEPGLAEQVFGRVLIHPEAAAQMLIGDRFEGVAARKVLEALLRGDLRPGDVGLSLTAEQLAVLGDIWQALQKGEYVAPVGRNPVVAVTSVHPVRVKLARTRAELALLGGTRVAAMDPLTAVLAYADFDQDQIAMLLPFAPKLHWTRAQYQELQAELSQLRVDLLRRYRPVARQILAALAKEHIGVEALRRGGQQLLKQAGIYDQLERMLDAERWREGVLTTRLIKTATTGPLYNELQRLRQYAYALWGPEEGLAPELAQRVGPVRTRLLELIEGLSHVAQEQLSIKAGKHGGRSIELTRNIQRLLQGYSLQALREQPQLWSETVEYLADFLRERMDYLERYQDLLPAAAGVTDWRTVEEGVAKAASRELAAQMLGAASLTRQAMEQGLGLADWLRTAAARRGLTRQEPPTLEEALEAARFDEPRFVTLESQIAAARLSQAIQQDLRQKLRQQLVGIRQSAAEWLSKVLPEGLRPGHPLEVLARSASPAELGARVAPSPATTGQIERATAQAVRQSLGKRLQGVRRGLAGREWIAAASVGAAIGLLGLISYRRSHEPLEVGGVEPAPQLYNPTPRVLPEDPRTGGWDIRILARRKRDIPTVRIGDAIGQAIETAARVPVDVRISERRESDDIDEAEIEREIARIIRRGA